MRTAAVALLVACALAPPAVADDVPKGVFDRAGGGTFHHPDRPVAFDVSPNGSHLASAGTDGSLRIWDLTKQSLLHTLSVKGEIVGEFRYSADGRHLFAHFGDGKVRRYEADAQYKPLGTTAAKHVDSFSVSADGRLIAGLDLTDTLKVLDVASGLDQLEVPNARAACLFADGKAVAVVSAENVLTVHAIPGGKPLHTVPAPKGDEKALLSDVAVSADGRRVAVAPEWTAGTVRVYELGKVEPVAEFAGEGPVRFVGEGRVIARHRGRVIVYDLTAKVVAAEIGDRVGAFAATTDGTTVVTDTGSGVGSARVRVWDVAKRTEVRAGESAELGGLLGTARGTDGAAWVFTTDRVFAWKPGQKPTAVVTLPHPASAFAASPGTLFIASADGLRAVSTSKPTDAALLPGSPKEIVSLAASADGGTLAGVDSAQRLVLCDGRGQGVRMWKLPAVAVGVAVQPDGKAVGVVGRDGFVRVWDVGVDPTKPTEKWKAKLARSPNAAVAYTPDGKTLVVASMLKVVLFDVETGKQLGTVDRSWEDGPFVSVAVSPDGALVAAGTLGTNGVAVWERASGTVVKRLTGAKTALWQLTFSDARTLLASGGDGSALAWDLSDRRGKPAAPTAAELKAAWESLGGGPAAFWQAAWVFADATDPWAAFADGIKSAKAVLDGIEKNATLLGDPDFATRERATKALLAAGVAALPAVKAVAETSDVPEAKRRAEDLVAKLTVVAGDPSKAGGTDELMRLKAAVRMAKRLGGPKAAGVLAELAEFGGEVEREVKR